MEPTGAVPPQQPYPYNQPGPNPPYPPPYPQTYPSPYPQAGQYPNFAPPPPPKKDRKVWPWVLGTVVGLIALGSVLPSKDKETEPRATSTPSTSVPLSTPDSKESSPSVATDTPTVPSASASASSATPRPTQEKDAEAAPAGSSVRDGKFEFTAGRFVGGQKEIGDNPYLRQKALGQYVIVPIRVRNISNGPQSFSPSNQKVIDTQGRKFETDAMGAIALGGSDIPVWDNINPGNSAEVQLVFDMPAGAIPAILEVHDSMFSSGATVKLS